MACTYHVHNADFPLLLTLDFNVVVDDRRQ